MGAPAAGPAPKTIYKTKGPIVTASIYGCKFFGLPTSVTRTRGKRKLQSPKCQLWKQKAILTGQSCRPSGQRCSLYARTRHERAHICRGDDGRGTSRSRATACSRRAATAWQKDGFVAGTRAPRSGLPRVSVRVLASMRTGSPSRRCSCMRSMRATQPVRHRPVIAHAPCVGALREPTERPVHFVPANVILFLYQGKDFPGNTFDDEPTAMSSKVTQSPFCTCPIKMKQ